MYVKILIFLRGQITLNWAIPEMAKWPVIMKFNWKSDKNFPLNIFVNFRDILDINRVAFEQNWHSKVFTITSRRKVTKWKMSWIWKTFGIYFLLFGVTFACVSFKGNLHFTSEKKKDKRLWKSTWNQLLGIFHKLCHIIFL